MSFKVTKLEFLKDGSFLDCQRMLDDFRANLTDYRMTSAFYLPN